MAKEGWMMNIIKLRRSLENRASLVNKGGVSHCGLGLFTLKSKYLKAKQRRIMETQIFHHAKIYLIFKK
jgi:hypothetical protein